jgi:dTDP-4-dehydrorhamnose 3,5-epimerase
MKILEVKALAIPAVKVIRFGRFADQRGYFCEPFRRSDFDTHPDTTFLAGVQFVQANESYSKPSTVRGLHFQWNPFMGKLVRTIHGTMVDIVLDIRVGSPTFGQAIMYELNSDVSDGFADWIWVPPGFAHGNYFNREAQIEYFCSGEYSPGCEASISPLAADIDWSLADAGLKAGLDAIVAGSPIITDKDRDGFSVAAWSADPRSRQFEYGPL